MTWFNIEKSFTRHKKFIDVSEKCRRKVAEKEIVYVQSKPVDNRVVIVVQ